MTKLVLLERDVDWRITFLLTNCVNRWQNFCLSKPFHSCLFFFTFFFSSSIILLWKMKKQLKRHNFLNFPLCFFSLPNNFSVTRTMRKIEKLLVFPLEWKFLLDQNFILVSLISHFWPFFIFLWFFFLSLSSKNGKKIYAFNFISKLRKKL